MAADLPNDPVDNWFCYPKPGETWDEKINRMTEHAKVYAVLYARDPGLKAKHDRERETIVL